VKIRKTHTYSFEVCKQCHLALKQETAFGAMFGCSLLKRMVIPDNIPDDCPLPDWIAEQAEFREIKCEK
jgi:hypothetical protein